MRKKSFGLDIGTTTVKMVSLSPGKDGFILDASIIAPMPAKGMISESPLDEEEMAQAIKKAASDAGIDSKFANVSLPETQVYTKVIEMPVLSDKELSSAIYWEAEQYIPIPLANITFVWSVLKRPQKATAGDKMEVLMVGAPTAVVNKYKKIVAMAGFAVASMETQILSAIRALVTPQFPPSLIIDIGEISTTLAIVKNGIMIFTYTTPTGGGAISRAIAGAFSLSQKEAEEYKKTYGFADRVFGGKISEAARPILMNILTEVKKALSFYGQKYKDEPIKQIQLSGGTAKLPGLNIFFANNCGIETVIATPWKRLASQQIPKPILDNGPEYTIAAGLAERDYE
ncbi:MAG: type IV pilus assembly protein PilM [Candidatus Levyibacteriota bacterium]